MSKAAVSSLIAFVLFAFQDASSAQLLEESSSSQQRQLQNYYANEETVYGSDRFVSYFQVEYATLFGTTDDIDDAARALSSAYNKLIVQFNDPFARRMDGDVRVLDATTGRRLTPNDFNAQERGLQSISILAILESSGTCNGCPSNSNFSNQVVNGRALGVGDGNDGYDTTNNGKGKGGKKSGGKGGSKGGSKYPPPPHYPDTGPDPPYLRPGLPTEAEILHAYSNEIISFNFGNIVDAIALDEIDEPPRGSTKKDGGKAGKKAGKKSSKKGGSSVKGGSKSGKGKGKGSSKSVGCISNPPQGERVAFTSYFRSLYSVIEDSTIGLEAAIQALAVAYNRLIQEFEAEVEMEDVVFFDFVQDRRLSWEEVEERRFLQGFAFNTILESGGSCIGCPNQFTLNNQINARDLKKGKGKGKGKGSPPPEPCLRPGLPTEEEVRLEYNKVLVELQNNFDEVTELEEIERPPPGKGKGKGGKGSKSGNRNRK